MNSQNLSMPMFIGRKNGVTITAGKATTAKVSMVLFQLDFNSTTQVNPTIDVTNIGNGKLPTPSAEGFTFDGWYSDSTLTTPITDFPDTSAGSSFVYPVAKFTKIVVNTLPTGTGIYYAKSLGQGDGSSPDSPKSLGTLLFDTLENYPGESAPRIYLLGNLSGQFEIMRSIHLIGALDGNENSKVTLSGSEEWVVTINSGINCTFTNIIIDGSTERTSATAQARGIINNGNLTLENSIITNCVATNGAGILNNGILTLEEGTSIINCSATGDGKSIYCDYEDGRTVKVNNYDFLSDAWYDSVIDETNPYSNTTWTITPPDTSVEGIYYANASGTGDGTTSEKARAFSALIADATLKNYSSDGCPRIYLLEDITGSFTISRNVRIEGVENEETHEKPTITGSGTPILTISNDVVCIIKGIDINGIISYRGITNNGTLTLNDCSITGCRNSEGAGIYNKGTLTLENGTSISRDEYSTKGKSIYCEYVDGKTVKVNNDIFTSDAWYDYSIDTTTPYDRDLWIKTATTGTGIYFAKASGSGDGRSLNNARALSSLLSETLTNSSEGYPVIYLMEDITISSGSSGLTISNKVKLIGAKGGVLNERVTIQKNDSSNSDSNTITFGSNSYIIQNVTIHGGGSNRGILNNGTLTLDNCEIKNASTEENGAGILNKGTVTLINGTIISGSATEKGNSIYCDSENGSTVKVNDDTFTSDAWYDDYINATTPYDSNSWRIAMPEGEGIYFANTNGQGDGTSISNPISLNTLISNTQPLTNYPGEDAPRIYLLDDITSALTVKKNVRIIGAKDGVIGQKTTLTRTGSGGTLLTINSSFTCTMEDVIIDCSYNGTATYQGITNNGILTLDNCEIKNATGENGAGILNKGTVTLINGTIISGSATGKGNSIYCDFENGSTVKVNNDTFTYDVWYDNAIDATTPYDSSSWTIGVPEGEGIYFANTNGQGDGTSISNPISLNTLISNTQPLTNYPGEDAPRIYLLDDIISALTVKKNVRIIGAKDGVIGQKTTLTRTGSRGTLLTINSSFTCTMEDVIIDCSYNGTATYQGITNNGILTLDNCEIKNASTEENGAGILNKGTVTLINGTSIIGYATEKGNSIYCDSENGSTVKVNDDTFTSDAWYDDSINATTPYDSSSWTIGVPEGEGIYFANTNGQGDGTSISNPISLNTLISNTQPLTNYPEEDAPRIYLLDDIISALTVKKNVRIIGAKDGVIGQKTTLTRTGSGGTLLTINSSFTCTIEDVIIDGNDTSGTATYQGISNSGTLTLDNCEIKNCSGTSGGGILNKGNLTLQNGTTIKDCQGSKGISIYCDSENGSTVKVNNDTFTSDAWYDNAIDATTPYDSSSWTIGIPEGTGIYFANASGTGNGSSMSNPKALSTLIADNTLVNYSNDGCPRIYLLEDITGSFEVNQNLNIIGAEDGIIGEKPTMKSADASVVRIEEGLTCTLEHLIIDGSNTSGTATYQGISNKGTLTLNKCNIKNCTATNGGGIYCDTGSLTLKDGSTVSGCNASNNGGGIYFSSSGTLTITDSTIGGDNESDKCTANYGGGIYTRETGSLEINGTSKIKNCTATSYGGGLFLSNTYDSNQITLNGTTISYCEANGNSTSGGGGIYVNCTNFNDLHPITISNCTIDHCTVRELGGAISITSGTMSVSETTISYCSTPYRGGALSCQGTCTLDTGTVITGCTASAGGALYAVGGGCNLTLNSNSQIDNCSATDGGAIFLYNRSTVTLESGAQITNCTASNNGGGIGLNTNATLHLTNGAIITGCKANNSKNSLFTISNSIINNLTISGETLKLYNYDITVDAPYDRNKLS